MKLLPKNLYSRLTLITVATVVTWYAIIYAYTAINSAEYAPSAPLTSTLMGKIVGNLDDLNSRSWWLNWLASYYNAWNVGIWTSSPWWILEIAWNWAKEVILNDIDWWWGGDMSLLFSNNWTKKYYIRNKDGLDFEISRYWLSGDFSLKNWNVWINTLNPIGIGGFGRSLNIAANAGPTIVLQDPDTTNGYRIWYFSFVDGVLTYWRALDDWSSPSPKFTVDGSNQFNINSLAWTYVNNSAFVCVNNSWRLYASETACP